MAKIQKRFHGESDPPTLPHIWPLSRFDQGFLHPRDHTAVQVSRDGSDHWFAIKASSRPR